MMCLDTNAVISVLNSSKSGVRVRLEAALRGSERVAVSSIVLFELHYGAVKSANPQRNAQRIADFLSGLILPLAFEQGDAEEAGDIRATLERAGPPIGAYDVLIAAQARRNGAVLITANRAEFARVPGLLLEDWTQP